MAIKEGGRQQRGVENIRENLDKNRRELESFSSVFLPLNSSHVPWERGSPLYESLNQPISIFKFTV